MLTIRCSSLDRVMACAGSLAESAAPYNPNSPEAREGTAAHEALALAVIGQSPDLDTIAARHEVDRDALGSIFARGLEAWETLRKHFPEPHTERGIADLVGNDEAELRGTADVLCSTPNVLAVLDWKMGWSPSEHTYQLLGYGCLAYSEYGIPTSGHVLCCEVWVRAGEIRVRRYDQEALDAFYRELVAQVRQAGKQYGPGLDACRYCPHQNTCVARADWIRGSVTALAPVAGDVAITRDLVGSIYERTKALGAALRRYDEVLHAMLAEGPVPMPDGRQIVLMDEQQDKIRPSKAMAYLRGELMLTPEEADEALRITKGGLERVLKARAPKGKGAAAMRETMKALVEAGAVDKEVVRKIKVTAA